MERPRTPFQKQVMEDTGIGTYQDLDKIISDRDKWIETSLIV